MDKNGTTSSADKLEKGEHRLPPGAGSLENNPQKEPAHPEASDPRFIPDKDPRFDDATDFKKLEQEKNPYALHCRDDAKIWQLYLKEAEIEDKDITDIWNSSLDSLLVFAGLFAGVVTAFLIESLKELKEDPQEALLQRIVDLLGNASESSSSQPFQPDFSARHINGLWIASLTLTLLSALGAVLAKGWVAKYNPATHREHLSDAYDRMLRVKRAEQWHLKTIITSIPLLIQISLLLFLVGLVIQITGNDLQVWLTAVILLSFSGILYIIGTILPWLSLACPFQTPISTFWPRQTARSRYLDPSAGLSEQNTSPKPWLTLIRSLPHSIYQFWNMVREEPTLPGLRGQILSWIITNSTNQAAIEEAVKAIAGLEPTSDLQDALVQSGAHNVLSQRLKNCVRLTPGLPKTVEDDSQLEHLLYVHLHFDQRFPTTKMTPDLTDSSLLRDGQALHRWDDFHPRLRALAFSLRVHMLLNHDQDDHEEDWLQTVESLLQLARADSPHHIQKILLFATVRGINGGGKILQRMCLYTLPRQILIGNLLEHANFHNDIKPVVSQLVNLLEDPDEDICCAAASAIGKLSEYPIFHHDIEPAASQLINLLKDSDEDICSAAALAVQKLSEHVIFHNNIKPAVSQLVNLLKDPDEDICSAAASALGKLSEHELFHSEIKLAASQPINHLKGSTKDVRSTEPMQICFNRRGSPLDLEEVILQKRKDVDLIPDGHSAKPKYLNHLGKALQMRFNRHGSPPDLEDAILQMRKAVSLTPDSHSDKPKYLNNLGRALHTRLNHNNSLRVLEEVILTRREAVNLTPGGHPKKPKYLINLGDALKVRYDHNSLLPDLEEAIVQMSKAADHFPHDSPVRAPVLIKLGQAFATRFEGHGNLADLKQALLAVQEVAVSQRVSSTLRLDAALNWAKYCGLESTSPLPAFEILISLFPQYPWLGLTADDQSSYLAKFGMATQDAVAAAVAEGKDEMAVEWAEQGRLAVWQNLLNLHTPVDELRARYPELAMQLQNVLQPQEQSLETQNALALDGTKWAESADSPTALAKEQDSLVNKIRAKTGFAGFMSPVSLEQLAPAVRDGPVVFLNLGEYRCDALALLSDENDAACVLPIPLERVTRQRARQLCEQIGQLLSDPESHTHIHRGVRPPRGFRKKGAIIQSILETLWLDYVKPVVDALAYPVNLESPPRMWWCTTGELTFLPLHAAGLYGAEKAGEFGCKLSDYVVSSYIPTITALLDRSSPHGGDPPKILMVIMSKTPGVSSLPKAEEEGDRLHRIASNLLPIALKNETATKARVVEELGQSSWVHLACHGRQTGGKPMESGFLLQDGKLELSEIVKMDIPDADFAFLSACSTAVGDEILPAESAPLAVGMLIAGYHGVVASMGIIQDNIAPRVAEDVYRYLFRNGQPKREEAAYALHRAVRSLQESGEYLASWVPFIHIGR